MRITEQGKDLNQVYAFGGKIDENGASESDVRRRCDEMARQNLESKRYQHKNNAMSMKT